MLTIIHGSDIISSRKYFLEEKSKHQHAQIFDGEKITLTDLVQIFEGGGFFEESKTIFIESIFAKKKSKTEFLAIAEYLQKQDSQNIFIWEAKELDKSSFLNFKTAQPKIFKLPQTLFALLDSIKPKNNKQLVVLFHQALETTDTEMIFFMLIRQVRLLLAVLETSKVQIDEINRLANWQKTKLYQQASLFTSVKLIDVYNKLFEFEVAQKTGNLSYSLVSSIDFLLLEI